MINKSRPNLPIPEPLRGSETGTFAHDAVARRLPNIIRRTIMENEFSSTIVQKLEALRAEIPESPIRPLEDAGAPDEEGWQDHIQPYLGLNWLEVPWFFAEFYLYRRVLEATGYFQPEGRGFRKDPYVLQKQNGLESAKGAIQPLAETANQWVEKQDRRRKVIGHILRINLWGNKADMSLWPVDAGEQSQVNQVEDSEEKIIIDDWQAVAEHLCGLKPGTAHIDLLLDNAGFELVTDLYMVDYLLSSGLAHTVVLHAKAYPVFVSDAMVKDVVDALDFMERQLSPQMDLVVNRLRDFLQEGRLVFRDDHFWTFPLALWEMPERLRVDLIDSDLVISKGDAQYRRLLGDRHWPPTTPFADIMSYFPSPILALRVGKSEVACGLEPGKFEALMALDPGWMTNGRWGWIQFRK